MKKQDSRISLFRRYADGLYTTDDVHRLSEEVHTPDVGEAFGTVLDEVWDESGVQYPSGDLEHEDLKKEARLLLQRFSKRRRYVFPRRIALGFCGVAVMFVLFWCGFHYIHYLTDEPVVWNEIATSHGERRQVALDDGTNLVLNSCSRIRFPSRFVDDERRVQLEGQAYFSVHHDEKHPFIVTTRHFDVRVLGTDFDIKSYASDEVISVQVENGKVQVDLPEAMMRLRAKEQVEINTVSGEYRKSHDDNPVALWRQRCLRFRNTPIRDVVKELEREYNCRIVFERSEDFNNLISGEHDNQSLESVLQSIEYTTGIHYRKEGDQIRLYN